MESFWVSSAGAHSDCANNGIDNADRDEYHNNNNYQLSIVIK